MRRNSLVILSRNGVWGFILGALLIMAGSTSATAELSFDTLKRQAEQGDVDSQYLMGKKLLTGDGIPVDEARGCEWTLKAAEKGHARAQNNVGHCYKSGLFDGTKDLERAVFWYTQAAEQNQEHGLYTLGTLYLEGQGVAKDERKGVELIRQAADLGFPIAQQLLGQLFEEGKVVDQDINVAITWYEKAADQGNLTAMASLGYLYFEESQGKLDDEKAYAYFRRAAEKGEPDAQGALCALYKDGVIVEQDFSEAFIWCSRAAEKGIIGAQQSLGQMYEKGTGVDRDVEAAISWYEKAAAAGDIESLVSLGYIYFEGQKGKPDNEKAYEYFRKAAEHGNANAQFKIGGMYDLGKGLEVNKEKAVEWYRRAAEQGHAVAQYNLGHMYSNGEGVVQDKEKAVELYRKSADQGYAYAQHNLGVAYDLGRGIKQNKEKAFEWYKKAAEQGHANAQYNLAYSYSNGEGVVENKQKAIEWYQKAAEQGHARSQHNLGFIYSNGKGVDEDKQKAFEWYRKAAEQGLADAQFNLGIMYDFGKGIKENKEKAFEWYRKAAEQGLADAQFNLGVMYDFGQGLQENKKQAVEWYLKAAGQGHTDAQNNLGHLYSKAGEFEDKAKAIEWFRKAAAQGHAPAQHSLGLMYDYGEGIEQDKEKAVEWYRKSAEQGYSRAQQTLGWMYESGQGVKQNYAEAVVWYRKAAEQQYHVAQYDLGRMYEDGLGVAKDPGKAIELYQAAVEKGFAKAQNNLGLCYQNGIGVERNIKEAARLFALAAEQGLPNSQMLLGNLYLLGDGVSKDPEKGLALIKSAAEQGYLLAINKLGFIYEFGDGAPKDYGKAFTYYREAAEKGDATAQNNLAELYLKGKGVRPDRSIARSWFEKAATQGDDTAKRNLMEMGRLEQLFLAVQQDGHTGAITDLVFDRTGRTLYSASHDKTIRAWDVHTGRMTQVYSGEIGIAEEGRYDALALSPDDKILAAGGEFPGARGSIRLFSVESGEIERVLEGHEDSVMMLTFSSDGAYLLSSGYDKSVKVWNLADGKLVASFAYDEHVSAGIFMPDRNVIVVASGSNLFWQDVRSKQLIRKIKAHDKSITSLMYLTRGKSILSAGPDLLLKEWGDDTGALKGSMETGTPVTHMQMVENLNMLFWSREDRFGALSLTQNGINYFRDRDRKLRYQSAAEIASTGAVAAIGHADGNIFLVNGRTGEMIRQLSQGVTEVNRVGFAGGRNEVIWKQGDKKYSLKLGDNQQPLIGPAISFIDGELEFDEQKESENGLIIRITGEDKKEIEILKDGQLLRMIEGQKGYFETVRLAPDGSLLITSDGGKVIRAYDAETGEWLWQRPFDAVTSYITDLAISADSRMLAVGERDQTVKLYAINTGEHLASLFYDGKDWIVWTPEGYYTGSLGGDRMITWHLNQGPDKQALRYSARRFAKDYFQPELVAKVLVERKQAGIKDDRSDQGQAAAIENIEQKMPPQVRFLEPLTASLTIESNQVRIKGKAVAPNGEPITDIWLLINGRKADNVRSIRRNQETIKKLEGGQAEIEQTLMLTDEQNIISLVAANRYSRSEPVMITVLVESVAQGAVDAQKTEVATPKEERTLYLLAVGVSEYMDSGLKLRYADADARELAQLFSSTQMNRVFTKVDQKVLLNKDATRDNILDSFDWLLSVAGQQDLVIIFVAGHGLKDQHGTYYFLPYDINVEGIRRSGVKWYDFNEVIYTLPSKVILMADTCYSGAISGSLDAVDISSVLREINTKEDGVVVMAASSSQEYSVENPDWQHGAFTKAVIEGLQGAADLESDRVVTIKELDRYISSRVPELTAGLQNPATEIPEVLPDFGLFAF